MRRPVVALLIALLALTLAGCGGGGGDQAAPADQGGEQAAETPPPAPAPSAEDLTLSDRSADSTVTFTAFPTGEFVPAAVTSRLESMQPMLILFANGDQRVNDDLRTQVNEAISRNRGLIDLLVYDLGKYSSVDSSGVVQLSIKPGDEVDPAVEQMYALARELGAAWGMPTIVIVDDQGMIIYKHRGFLDADLLDRQMQRATQR